MDMGDMDMGGGVDPTMTSFLHFVPFTNALWFKEWTPSSHGALFGACFGLFVLGMVERLLSGMRGVLETYWRRKTDAILYRRHALSMKPASSDEKSTAELNRTTSLESGSTTSSTSTVTIRRLLPPFIIGHELARAVLRTAQSFVGFAIMLAVMTFNASFVISILIGVFAGELLFGRYASLLDHHA